MPRIAGRDNAGYALSAEAVSMPSTADDGRDPA